MTKRILMAQLLLPLVYALPFLLTMLNSIWYWLIFLLGLYLGIALLIVDEKYLYKFYVEATDLVNPNYQLQLITRSVLFLLAYVPLAIFVLTSSGSLIGIGLILGIGLGILVEMWQLYKNQLAFKNRFLLQVKKDLDLMSMQKIVLAQTAFFAILSLLVLL